MKGSLRERSPGAWELRVFIGRDPITGRPRQVSRSFRGTKNEAQTQLARLITEHEDELRQSGKSRTVAPAKMTVTDLITMYISEHDGAPGTIDGYRSVFANHIVPHIGALSINRLDAPLLDRLYRHLVNERGLAASSVRSVHALIRGALREAVRRGWLSVNVARDAKLPTVRRNGIVLPSAEQVLELVAESARYQPDFGVFVRLAAATGARRGELCALRWTAVNLAAAEVLIETSVAVTSGGLVEKDTKNHTRRTVALDPVTVDGLKTVRERAIERAKATGHMLAADAFVFSNDANSVLPWRPDTVTAVWERVRTAVGAPGVRLHDLRHFQATMLLKAGMPVKNVSKRLGHRDAATTLNVYAQFLEETDRESADIIGKLLSD